jgi:hypothetical protein
MENNMAENTAPTINDRFKMPDIYDSGIRGANGKSPEQRAKEAQAADEQKKKDKLKGKKKGLDDQDDEEEDDPKPKKKKKGGFVLIPHSTYEKHFGKKKAKK